MPGYGKSTANKVYSAYAQSEISQGLLALLADTGRKKAVWVAHDWGSGCLVRIIAETLLTPMELMLCSGLSPPFILKSVSA